MQSRTAQNRFLGRPLGLAAHVPAMIFQLALLSRPYFSGNTERFVGIANVGQVDIRQMLIIGAMLRRNGLGFDAILRRYI